MTVFIKRVLLYLGIVIIPFIIATTFYINYQYNKDFEKNTIQAKQIASIHERQWNLYINKVVSSLDILSLSIQSNIGTKKELELLLNKVYATEQAYGGLFVLDQYGKTVARNNDTDKSIDLSTKSFIQEVIEAKDIVIANKVKTISNGQRVIGIAMPILNEQKGLEGIMAAYLRVDYISNTMKILTPTVPLAIVNANNEQIFHINKAIPKHKKTVSLEIDRLPWKIVVEIKEPEIKYLLKKYVLTLLFFILFFHFIYLVYIMYTQRTLRRKEQEQNQIQKLELVGNLAASSAHEIRNPLTGIKGLIQLLSEKHKDQEDQFYFSIIQKEITRINEIVSEFLILGKPTAQKREPINLNAIISDVEPLIQSEANLHNVNYTKKTYKGDLYFLGTADQMKQVLLNITRNALEAMEYGGVLELTITKNKKSILLTLTDNGIGISDEQLKKIFLPFNTSKDTGTGLGLVVCKRIIESFNGEIHITSKSNKGTKVEIILPLLNGNEQ